MNVMVEEKMRGAKVKQSNILVCPTDLINIESVNTKVVSFTFCKLTDSNITWR